MSVFFLLVCVCVMNREPTCIYVQRKCPVIGKVLPERKDNNGMGDEESGDDGGWG